MNNELTIAFIECFAKKYLKTVLPDEILSQLNQRSTPASYQQQIKNWDQKIAVLHHWEGVIEPTSDTTIEIYLKQLKQALFKNKKIWLGYEGKEKKFQFNPFGLVVRDQQYFIVGSQWDYQNPLLYAVRNITHINLTDQAAIEPPAGFDLHQFSRLYLNYHDTDTLINTLEIEFPESMRSYIEAYPIVSKTLNFSADNNGYFTLTATEVVNSKRFQQWLSGFHTGVHIKQPEFLRQIINKYLVDNLTKLYNRNFFDHLILREVQHCLRDVDYCFSLLTLDIDHFKKINDTHGHNIGDEVLTLVANVLRNEEGIRYGGEEFYVVLSGQDENAAYTIAERIRKSIAAIKYQSANNTDNSLTISIGIADLSKALIPKGEYSQFTIQQLKKRADDALYLAKKERNCCKKHSECKQL